MVPWEVGIDPRLGPLDVRVFFVLAACRHGSTATLGVRLIAKYARTSQRRALKSLASLAAAGYIEIAKGTTGARSVYQIPWFSRQPQEAALESSGGVGQQSDAQALRCPKCRKHCRKLLKVGHCRSCNWDLKMDRKIRGVVREEIDKGEVA